MTHPDPVLVVGTTTDYIDWIRNARPGGALFLTDPVLRRDASEPPTTPQEEICCELADPEAVHEALLAHLKTHRLSLSGIACFDCENMLLTADLATRLGLPYPARTAVYNCRSKLAAKRLWQQAHVPCPHFHIAQTADGAAAFADQLAAPCVIKPLSGAGSELTFRCDGAQQARTRFEQVRLALDERRELPMFNQIPDGASAVLLEEWVDGIEYSCDFIVDHGRVTIVRMARKYVRQGTLFGITAAYELLAGGGPFDEEHLRRRLAEAAGSLGIERAFCMIDIIDRAGGPVFLEMAPRPGGDCLPWLLRQAAGDVIDLYLDFCQGRPVPPRLIAKPYVAVRLFADRAGVLRKVDTDALAADARVREVYLKRRPGDMIDLPPADYDSWILGHAVYAPDPQSATEQQNDELAAMVRIEWD